MRYYDLIEFEQASPELALNTPYYVRNIFFHHLFNLSFSDGISKEWERYLRVSASLDAIRSYVSGRNLRKLFRETKGKVVLIEEIWEKTRDIYKAARSPKGRFVSKKLVRDYVLSHKSMRVIRKNGKKGSTNKTQFLQIRRSLFGLEWIPLSEKRAEELYRLYEQMIRVPSDSHVYLYGAVEYAIVQYFEHEGVLDEIVSEPSQQNFGSFHITLDDLFSDSNDWSLALEEFIERVSHFVYSESIKVYAISFDVVVRSFNKKH